MTYTDKAMVKSNFDRIQNEAYYSRDIILMDSLYAHAGKYTPSKGKIWEPCAGGKHITTYLKNRGYDVLSTDLKSGVDYFEDPEYGVKKGYYDIITNPPFDQSEKFVREGLKVLSKYRNSARNVTMSVLLRNEWDCAGKRNDIFNSDYFAHKIVIQKRPLWVEKTPESSSPRHNYAWYIFSNEYYGQAKSSITSYYHPSGDTLTYEKVGRKYKRKYKEQGNDYIYD